MAETETALQSPTKLRLHKKHYLNEVVQKRVHLRRENSTEVDLSSISRINFYPRSISSDGGEGEPTSNGKPENSQAKAARSSRVSESLPDSSFFDDNKVESVCSLALSVVDGVQETEGGVTKHELQQFIEECFNLPETKMQQLQETSRTVKKRRLNLTCHVFRAKELTLKDTNGTRDLYCQLGVLNENHQDKDVVKQKKNIKDWQKDKLIESTARTSVGSGDVEPEWDEVVKLLVSKPRKEMLVVEIWNGDDTNRSFVGRFFYPLLYIPVSGIKKTFTLRSHSEKSERGFVTVKLNMEQESCLLEFSELTSAVVNVCTKENGSYIRRWDGALTPGAERLLEEYAALNDIDELSKACIHLSVLVRYHKLYAVSMSVICDLIREIKRLSAASSKNPPVTQYLWEELFDDLSGLREEMEAVMEKHLQMFNFESETDLEKFKECVQTLCEIYSFKQFLQLLPSGSDTLKATLENCIAAAVRTWFQLQDAQMQPQLNTNREKLVAFKELSEICLRQCRVAVTINSIFAETDVDYFSIFYTALDPLVGNEPETRMKDPSSCSDATTYEIYRNYRQMAKMAQCIDESGYSRLSPSGERKTLLLPLSHKWFQEMVKHWITVAANRCKDFIVKAIEADSAIAITDEVKFSTSAVDVTGFLIKLGNFWKNLEWPEAIAAYGFASNMMEEINACAQFYMEKVAKRLNYEDVFDEQGKFRATEKLCIVLNDMQHVRRELSRFEEQLELEQFYKWLSSSSEPSLGSRCREMVSKLLGSADDDIYNRMSKIVSEITNKLSPDIQTFVKDIVSGSKNNGNKEDLEVITPLMDYLTCNLQTFANHLLPDVFEIILGNLWQLSLDCVLKCLREVQLKKGSNSAQLHKRSFTLLNALKKFYHCEGDGLKEAALKTDTYNRLFSQLEVLHLATDDLILRFLSELVEFQRREIEGDKQLGTLQICMCHNKKDSVVEVNVVRGEKLPGLSKGGVSDLLVQLSLMPHWVFQNSGKVCKTAIQKKTVDPVYDETFRIHATEAEMAVEGAVLLLSVFDHSAIGSDQLAGMCVVACKDVPESTCDVLQRSMALPLFRFTDMTFSFAEIEARANFGDTKASHFIKSNVKKLLSYLPRPRSRSRSKSGSLSYLEERQAQAVQLS